MEIKMMGIDKTIKKSNSFTTMAELIKTVPNGKPKAKGPSLSHSQSMVSLAGKGGWSSTSSMLGNSFAPQVTFSPDGKVSICEMAFPLPASLPTPVAEHSDTAAKLPRSPLSEKWTTVDTDKFYEGLSQYGTDFSAIQLLFANRTRR